MGEEAWSKENFIEAAKPYLIRAYADPATLLAELHAFFQEAFPHCETATQDGKEYVDKVMSGTTKILANGVAKAPDNPETRKIKRALSSLQGKHFAAKDLLEVFETMPEAADAWMENAVSVFTTTLQTLMDVLHDITQNPQSGPAQFAQTGLFYWLIDELAAAQSLARRNHATLAYTHLRSCMEILDKVELFGEKPEFAKIWVSGDEHEIWKKLSPGRVREQLSREPFDPKKKSYDPIYEYLSQQGSHSTFTALQSRVRSAKKPESSCVSVSIVVGGISDPAREISIVMYAIMLANLGIMKAVGAFPDRLNLEDVFQMVVGLTDTTFAFYDEYFSSLDASRIDRQPFELLYAAWQQMRETVRDTTVSRHNATHVEQPPS